MAFGSHVNDESSTKRGVDGPTVYGNGRMTKVHCQMEKLVGHTHSGMGKTIEICDYNFLALLLIPK